LMLDFMRGKRKEGIGQIAEATTATSFAFSQPKEPEA